MTRPFSSRASRIVPRPHRRRPRGQRGFTLIELLVSLVAGLIVGLAVVSLSKNVANQFYEEVRANAAETSVRLASQRLRSDLSRAGLMTTGNIFLDPRASHAAGGNGAKGLLPLQHLTGIRIVSGGSLTPITTYGLGGALAPPAAFATAAAAQAPEVPALTPDALAIYGNLTSGDEYFGSVDPGAPPGCGGKVLRLNLDDPSLLRILRDVNGVAVPAAQAQSALQQVFAPIGGHAFYARVTDTKGYYHYAATCVVPASWDGTNAYVYLQDPTATLTSLETGSQFGGVDGFETVSVSPIQGAYWFVGRVTTGALGTAGALVENAASVALSTQKFDLYRAWISADGAGTILTNDAEVVAEFAVDFKLGFTVDDPAQPEGSPAKALAFGFTSLPSDKNPWANRDITTAAPSVIGRGTQGPHRIRSVRYRLTTRAATPDRDQALPPPPGSDFLYRYRIGALYARARVTQGEVALVNQARMNY